MQFADTPPRPPFDPEIEPMLRTVAEMLPAMSAETVHEIRRMVDEGHPDIPVPDWTAGGRVVVDELRVPGPTPDAPEVRLLVLTPATGSGPWPCVYFIHGGGMVSGDRHAGPDVFYLEHVAEGRAVVVSVEYRLAPEHPHPAPSDDCYAGLLWVARNAQRLRIDPERLIVSGMSAGGGLAAGVVLRARDAGEPAISHQILICPMLDDRLTTPSSRMLDGEGGWDRNANLFGWTALLGDSRGGPDVSPYAAPARAEDLTGLPRTYLDCGSSETFRDEILDYAERLSQAGVSVDLHMWGGGFHGFDAMMPDSVLGRASRAARDEFIERALRS